MKSKFMQMLCRVLVVAMVMLPLQSVHAGMIGSGQVAAASGAQAERIALLGTVDRADVASQLQSMGVDPAAAKQRISAMTDEEVRALSNNVNSAPAGASSNGWVWAAVIIIAVVVWYNWK